MNVVKPYVGHGKGREVSRDMCFDPNSPISKFLGSNLPHWYQEGKIMFFTYRLADSLPTATLERFRELYESIISGDFVLIAGNIDEFLSKIEYYLNQGAGECLLKYDRIQRIVVDNLLHHDGVDYDLYDFVVMPNHVHFLALPYEEPSNLISSIKSYTAKQINKEMNRSGMVWQGDYFDKIIRSVNDFQEKSEYIKQNPLLIK